MIEGRERLRVALLAGTLGQGGAEKQLLYMARALRDLDFEIKVCSLTKGEFYESALRTIGVEPVWIGRFESPLFRLGNLARSLLQFKPDILQSAHFFTNLYIYLAARVCGATTIGSVRCDVNHAMNGNRRWGGALLRRPASLLANSFAAKRTAEKLGVESTKIHVLPNVIDIAEFDREVSLTCEPLPAKGRLVAAVGNLIQAKRFDRFLVSLNIARRENKDLTGIIIGDGPERQALELMAADLRLRPDGVFFLGRRTDVASLLSRCDMLLLTSDHEGFPNVILEAMAARIPVVTSPAGDAGTVVQHGVTGFVTQFDDVRAMAGYLATLAAPTNLRERLGRAGRDRLERCYDFSLLAGRLVSVYRAIAKQQCNHGLLSRLPLERCVPLASPTSV